MVRVVGGAVGVCSERVLSSYLYCWMWRGWREVSILLHDLSESKFFFITSICRCVTKLSQKIRLIAIPGNVSDTLLRVK